MRRWPVFVIVLAVAAAVAWAWWVMPPAIVRSLPPGQTLVYVNWKPVRELLAFSSRPMPQSAPYAAFVRDSGFDYQRDLDAVALSLEGQPTQPTDATVILRGGFGPKFTAYLQRHALRQERVGGATVYLFPGWARPSQLLSVVMLGSHEVLVTNAREAAPIIEHAEGWRWSAGRMWQAGNDWRLLVGYGAVNAEELEAAQALDGTQPPWQGVERVEFSLRGGSQGVELSGRAQAANSAAAAALQGWLQNEFDALRPAFAEQPGKPSLRALLDGVRTEQTGRAVRLQLRVDAATLQQWASALR